MKETMHLTNDYIKRAFTYLLTYNILTVLPWRPQL